jgi:hypothetical protein
LQDKPPFIPEGRWRQESLADTTWVYIRPNSENTIKIGTVSSVDGESLGLPIKNLKSKFLKFFTNFSLIFLHIIITHPDTYQTKKLFQYLDKQMKGVHFLSPGSSWGHESLADITRVYMLPNSENLISKSVRSVLRTVSRLDPDLKKKC